MNRKLGMTVSLINAAAVTGFGVSMLIGADLGSYFFSLFIAFSFVPMMCVYSYFSDERVKSAGNTAVGFAVMYAAIISLVYFAQLTTVRAGGLTPQALNILDFQRFGLFFNFDMLGYAMMSLSTFFAGLTVEPKSKNDKLLKRLLLIHGVFFISCIILPMLGLFTAGSDEADFTGVAILTFWCLYFLPIDILSFHRFSKMPE